MIDEGQGGFLFDVGDVSGMAGALKKLEAHRDLCQKMGEYNQVKAYEEYTYSEVVKKLTGLYSEVMNDSVVCVAGNDILRA